jgi:hypothetical protein
MKHVRERAKLTKKKHLILIFLNTYSHVLCRETSAVNTYLHVLYRGPSMVNTYSRVLRGRTNALKNFR